MSFPTQTYGFFELAAMSAPDDNYGYRARAAREGRVYDTFASDGEDDELAPEDEAAEETAIPEPVCPERFALWQTVSTAPIGELAAIVNALRSHSAECAACGSGRKIVMTDRELLDANAVCCEGKAA